MIRRRSIILLLLTVLILGCEAVQKSLHSFSRTLARIEWNKVTPTDPNDVAMVFVHGTTHISTLSLYLGNEPWTDPNDNSTFAAHCIREFKQARPTAQVHGYSFDWGGDNDNADRHNGGIALAQFLDQIPPRKETHIIAHSHGGNVALRALTFSRRDSDTLTLLGTPFLGVGMKVPETGKKYFVPLYLPLPEQASNTLIVNVYSPEDSVATLWADILPGVTFTDLEYTNAEAWRHFWRLDSVRVRKPAPRGKRPVIRTQPIGAEYDFEFGDGVVSQTIDPGMERKVFNIGIPAKTFLDLPKKWVHSKLHSPEIGDALGSALARRNFSDFQQNVGVIRK